MTFVPNTSPTFVKQPRLWQASIGNGDASAWKPLLRMDGTNAGANGSKVSGILAASNDTVARVLQLALLRSYAGAAITLATPGVVSWALANGNNVAIGDQIVFLNNGDALPTGLAFNTTYYVISGGFVAGSAFELATSAGGSAIATSGSQSGTHLIAVVRPLAANTVAITAGSDGATNTAGLMALGGNAFPLDSDGNPFIPLEAQDYLAVSATTTLTANKIVSVSAFGGDF